MRWIQLFSFFFSIQYVLHKKMYFTKKKLYFFYQYNYSLYIRIHIYLWFKHTQNSCPKLASQGVPKLKYKYEKKKWLLSSLVLELKSTKKKLEKYYGKIRKTQALIVYIVYKHFLSSTKKIRHWCVCVWLCVWGVGAACVCSFLSVYGILVLKSYINYSCIYILCI